MIQLQVGRDKQGRLLILSPKRPYGLEYVFRKTSGPDALDLLIKAMWKEYNFIFSKRESYLEGNDRAQQKLIKKLIKQHFGFSLTWKAAEGDVEGWPTDGFWSSNRRFITKLLKQNLTSDQD
jgi:hypothetical protein